MPSNWKLEFRQRGDHRIYSRRTDGAISICDNSGPGPDYTDDGPLIVKPGTVATLGFSKLIGALFYSVPVHCERDDRSGYVSLTPEVYSALRMLVPLHTELTQEAVAMLNVLLVATARDVASNATKEAA